MLLEKHGANPNVIIPKLNIAPIHYAVGFDKLEFAEKVTALFLKKRGDPNLFSEGDRLTPLHIACIWGRPSIVQLLLEHGGNLDVKCKDGQTPIQYAIQENYFGVIEVIQKFVFEKKIDDKKRKLIIKSLNPKTPERSDFASRLLDESPLTPIRNNHLKNAIQSIDEKKFTPNRINYNFDVTSPYYVNITHRRHKRSEDNSKALEDDSKDRDQSSDQSECEQKNLFELTEKNLQQFSQQMSKVIVIDRLAIHKRRSYINAWREKIQQVRRTNLMLDVSYVNYLNSCNDVTLLEEKSSKDSSNKSLKASSDDSFITAEGGAVGPAVAPNILSEALDDDSDEAKGEKYIRR